MADADETRICPTCGVGLLEDPAKGEWTCLVHGVFVFRDRMALPEVEEPDPFPEM